MRRDEKNKNIKALYVRIKIIVNLETNARKKLPWSKRVRPPYTSYKIHISSQSRPPPPPPVRLLLNQQRSLSSKVKYKQQQKKNTKIFSLLLYHFSHKIPPHESKFAVARQDAKIRMWWYDERPIKTTTNLIIKFLLKLKNRTRARA